MPARKADRPTKDWYSISVDTLRGWGFLLGILAAAGLAWLGYRAWESKALEREARGRIEEVRDLLGSVQKRQDGGDFTSELGAAVASYDQARGEYDRGAYREALASAQRSRTVLLALQEALSPGGTGQARFISVQGEVEYRRASGGDWEEARTHVQLRPGDYVRTAGGSAEILFLDGTLYSVRPSTQIIVSAVRSGAGGAAEQAVQMEYGWLDLNTAERPSKVLTPSAEARVDQESEAFISVDRDSKRGRFGTIRGVLELAAKGGMRREVREQQQVVQTGDLLSEPEPLPARPEPLEPIDNFELDPREQKLVLTWRPVEGAGRYALQVSRTHLFVDNVIDVTNRTKTSATLGVQGEGTFQWRVAAFDRDGQPGPWSAARKFRVASFKSGGGEGDTTPPQLDLADVRTYGSILIVGGKSEPGSQVFVNGEPVKLAAGGSFTKTIQLTKEGWSFIEIRAQDGSGNETVSRQRVFVENP